MLVCNQNLLLCTETKTQSLLVQRLNASPNTSIYQEERMCKRNVYLKDNRTSGFRIIAIIIEVWCIFWPLCDFVFKIT